MYAHIKNKHPEKYAATKMKSSQPKNKKSLTVEVLNSQLFEIIFCVDKNWQPGNEHKQLTRSVMYWLAKDRQPQYSVEKPDRQNLLS